MLPLYELRGGSSPCPPSRPVSWSYISSPRPTPRWAESSVSLPMVPSRSYRSSPIFPPTTAPAFTTERLSRAKLKRPLPRDPASRLPLAIRTGFMDQDTFYQFYGLPRKYLPPVLRHHRLAKCLAGLQTLLGSAVISVSSWIYIYSPSLGLRDVPFWSGIPLFLSGLLGLLLLCCCRKDYPGYPLSCCFFSFKVTSLTVSVVAGVTCFCAVTFAGIHLLSLHYMMCEPEDSFRDFCICRTNSTNYVQERAYLDLSCPEVQHMLTLLLATSAAINVFGGVLIGWYLYLHWSSRYSYVYSQVRTSEHKPMVISNKL